jgi:DNA (cytosine-5)-methyltransferase 1
METLHELALFAGAGGGILGGHLLGWRTVCAVERDPYAVGVLLARQNDGCLPPFPIWDDVSTFDGRPWRGRVDVVSGGFPCQDISAAGRGAGITGARSGLWGEMARIIREVRPRFVLVENSPMLTLRGLDVVLGDLAAMGFDAEWGVLGADDVGAPHKRERIWIVGQLADAENDGARWREQLTKCGESAGNVANAHDHRQREPVQYVAAPGRGTEADSGSDGTSRPVADTMRSRSQGSGSRWFSCDPAEEREGETDRAFSDRVGHIWGAQSRVDRVAHGVAARVDRLKCIGNGQVPAVAALAWRILRR